ncbi:MAG TPA: hypothetical protein VJU18_13540 [Vicinamibacteria bacterium]|nr:hypothetical protein [Vicinamibacteria bacterium]
MNQLTHRKRLPRILKCLSRAVAGLGWALLASNAWAAPAKPASTLVNVADTRGLSPGLTRWVADVYNTSYWLFGVLVVVIMVAMGLGLGYGCDRLMARLGINLGRIEHHE